MQLSPNDAELISSCDAITCDLDGTLYLEDVAIEGAKDFLDSIIQSGRKLFYFTNNTSASRRSWLNKLKRLNFPAADENLITAADCADAYLKRNNFYPRIYLVGNSELQSEFHSRGFQCLKEKETENHPPEAVVLGFDTELNYQKIRTCYDLVLKNIPFIATHGDVLCPVAKNKFKPDVGSFISLFETATGGIRPTIVGKPSNEAVRYICERADVDSSRIAFVGDRLYTDIRMAQNSGMVGILVLSGETNKDMLENSQDQPKIIVDSVADLTSYF